MTEQQNTSTQPGSGAEPAAEEQIKKEDPDLIEFKERFIALATALDKFQQPQDKMCALAEAFQTALDSGKAYADPLYLKFLDEDLIFGLAKRLTKKCPSDEKFQEAVAQCLLLSVRYFTERVKNKKDFSFALYFGMTQIFQYDTLIHKLCYQMPDQKLQRLRTSHQQWRNELKEGDMIDAYVKCDRCSTTYSQFHGWLQGRVASVDPNGNTLNIVIDNSINAYDCSVDRWSTNVATFEAKTKDDYAWRAEFLNGSQNMLEVDINDKGVWRSGTILEYKKQKFMDGREVLMANCALRVYRPNTNTITQQKDELGAYKGFSNRFDEWIPVYSPRICPWASHVGKTSKDNDVDLDDLEEEMDELFPVPEGMQKAYAVPRAFQCKSEKFIEIINLFGNLGGFEIIMDLLENATMSEKEGELTIKIIGCLAQIITNPFPVYHKWFIGEFGQRIKDAIAKRLLTTSDQSLRDVRKEQIDSVIKAMENISKRFLNKDTREKEIEVTKLELCNKCLTSNYLERRIQGIRDLNTLVKKITQPQYSYSYMQKTETKAFSAEFLIEWMKEHQVFQNMWDPKKTHLQIVQRTDTIFLLLLKEDKFETDLLKLFWSLREDGYQAEVFKIISDNCFWLKEHHVAFIFDELTNAPAEKLNTAEFDCICDLGKYNKSTEFSTKVCDFFWQIILNSNKYNRELIDQCIKKFAEMIKYWSIPRKTPFITDLAKEIGSDSRKEQPSVPVLQLMQKLIKDQMSIPTGNTNAANAYYNSYGNSSYGNSTSGMTQQKWTRQENGTTITSYSYTNNPQPQEKPAQEESVAGLMSQNKEAESATTANVVEKKQDPFDELLSSLNNDEIQLVSNLFKNLKEYCATVKTFTGTEEGKLALEKSNGERSKLYVINQKYSHAQEVEERLSLLKYYASISDFSIRKVQLKVIYDLLAKGSGVPADGIEVLTWFKDCCEANSSLNNKQILDLDEVGEFCVSLIANNELPVATLPLVGFEFLQNFIIGLNESNSNLVKMQKPVKTTQFSYGNNMKWNATYMSSLYDVDEEPEKEDENEPLFKLVINPSKLLHLNLVWQLVLEAQNAQVVPKATKFLIKCYMSLSDVLSEERASICQDLIAQCIQKLKESHSSTIKKRLIAILQNAVTESETKGIDVQPHSAMLHGECLNSIVIKNKSKPLVPSFSVRVYTSATCWEFVDRISRMCDLAPQYTTVILNKRKINAHDYGKTLGEMGFKNHDVVTVQRNAVVDSSASYPLLNHDKTGLSDRASKVFNTWFDMFSEQPAREFMTPLTATYFIKGATNEEVAPNEHRIASLFTKYDSDKDEKITRAEFLKFYFDAASGTPERVYENLKSLLVRAELVRMPDIVEDFLFPKDQMPRYTLSADQSQFDTLFSLLDIQDDGTGLQDQVWSLIRMLSTNRAMYEQVLKVEDSTQQNNKIDWAKFFTGDSIYKQIYKMEIVEAVMEEGDEGLNLDGPRVEFVEFLQKSNLLKPISGCDKAESKYENSEELNKLKEGWTCKFLQQGGLEYVIDYVMNNTHDTQQSEAHQKRTSFMLVLLKVFLSSSFDSNSKVEENDEKEEMPEQPTFEKQTSTGVSKKQLGELSKQYGAPIFEKLDFCKLAFNLLNLIKATLNKNSVSHSFEAKMIIQNALGIFAGSLMNKPQLFAEVRKYEGLDEIITSGVLYCREDNIRDSFRASLLLLATYHKPESGNASESALGYLLGLLSKKFVEIGDYSCRQFFILFLELIDLFYGNTEDSKASEQIFDAEILLSQIIDKLREDKSSTAVDEVHSGKDDFEIKRLKEEREKMMIGMLLMIKKIFSKADPALVERIVEQKDFIGTLFREYLFAAVFKTDTNSNESNSMFELAKAKAAKSRDKEEQGGKNTAREVAYDLLIQLVKKSPLLMSDFIRDHLNPLLSLIRQPKGWNFQPDGQMGRAAQKYVGLKNLGCICYMNSMMQQFFMIPAFRYNMLCVDDGVKPDMVQYKNDMHDDNMLHQMQRLMAHLELSQRVDYNPVSFCFAFKEFDGTPTNTAEQKDAQEFLNVLFDRVEEKLKPTPQKYLLQSIFGGKTCSQTVCSECGKVKNRIEDYYNLSLTVKDIPSVYESLKKQIEGEIISDYKCDGCGKKVDLSKRTLITETPNVLILHLQRIVFNFETFNNDKLNQHFDFPMMLDLKPYSFHEVMRTEGRLDADGNLIVNKPEETAAEEGEEKKEESDEEPQPDIVEDDCFEYKLVGVNVHSGTANAGHYWSYINTKRGFEACNPEDPKWADTEADPWMEFNDSTVKDFSTKNIKSECFGDAQGGSSGFGGMGGWGGFSGSYGKSGYMLFYERRKKKPIKQVVEKMPEDEKEQEKYEKIEKTGEIVKKIPYTDLVSQDATPNEIFNKVKQDNTQYSFENDVYSPEFFNFIKEIIDNVAAIKDEDVPQDQKHLLKQVRLEGLEVAQKANFEILARCFSNEGMKTLSKSYIDIFARDEELLIRFMNSMIEEKPVVLEMFLEMLIDSVDNIARSNAAYVLKVMLCRLKMIEKKDLLENARENITKVTDAGETIDCQRAKSLSARFIEGLIGLLNTRVAKHYTRFEQTLDVISSFALYSPEEVESTPIGKETKPEDWDINSEATRIGLTYLFQANMLEKIMDFMLGPKSPMLQAGETRISMTSTYMTVNFSPLLKIVTAMVGSVELCQKYPLTDICKQMLRKKDVLGKLVDAGAASKDFGDQLAFMCKDNLEMTRKLAKIFVTNINSPQLDRQALYLKGLKKFLRIEDKLKQQRLEWVFGIGQIVNKREYGNLGTYSYGVELVERINDDAYTYVTTWLKTGGATGTTNALFASLLSVQGRMDNFCAKALKNLLSLCVKDREIARFVYNAPPPTYQHARYSDWFKSYIESQKTELGGLINMSIPYYNRLKDVNKAIEYLGQYDQLVKEFLAEDLAAAAATNLTSGDKFQEFAQTWRSGKNPEVVEHWPPQVIIGKQVGEELEICRYEDDRIQVRLVEISCEYMPSNPTGLFNLSLPNKMFRTKAYEFINYASYCEMRAKTSKMAEENAKDHQKAKEGESANANEAAAETANETSQSTKNEDTTTQVNETFQWADLHQQGRCLLRVEAKRIADSAVKTKVLVKGLPSALNGNGVPVTPFETKLWGRDSQILGYLQIAAPSVCFREIDMSKVSLQVETILCLSGNRVAQMQSSTHTSTAVDAGVGTQVGWSITGDIDNAGIRHDYFSANEPVQSGYTADNTNQWIDNEGQAWDTNDYDADDMRNAWNQNQSQNNSMDQNVSETDIRDLQGEDSDIVDDLPQNQGTINRERRKGVSETTGVFPQINIEGHAITRFQEGSDYNNADLGDYQN